MNDRKEERTAKSRATRDERDDSAAARQRARERAAEDALPRKSGAPKRVG